EILTMDIQYLRDVLLSFDKDLEQFKNVSKKLNPLTQPPAEGWQFIKTRANFVIEILMFVFQYEKVEESLVGQGPQVIEDETLEIPPGNDDGYQTSSADKNEILTIDIQGLRAQLQSYSNDLDNFVQVSNKPGLSTQFSKEIQHYID
ncbi:hypothetical protein OTU49_004530, partial [Cherax quadricarinatus]